MRPYHKTLSTLLVIGVVSSMAWADFATAFKAVPDNAIVVITLKNMAEADQKINKLIDKLEMRDMATPEQTSLVSMLQDAMTPGEQFDANGSLTFALIKPGEQMNIMMAPEYILILAPTKNGAKMLEDMEATKYPSGISEVVRQGETAYALPMGSHVAFSPSQELLETLAERDPKKSLADKMTPEALKGMEDLDLVCWINADELIKTTRPLIESFKPMLMMGVDPNDPIATANQKNTIRMIDMALDGMAGLSFGLGLNDDGVPLRSVFYVKPNSEMGRRVALASKVEGPATLNSLPDGEMLLAITTKTNPESLQIQYEDSIAPFVDAVRSMKNVDAEQMKSVESALTKLTTAVTASRTAVYALPKGSKGVVGMSAVSDLTDTAGYFEMLETFVTNAKAIAKGVAGDEFTKYIDPLTFELKAGKVGELPYHKLGYDLWPLLGFEEEDIEDFSSILGPDGLSVRMIPVNDKRIVTVFGGGDAFAKKAVEAAASDDAPLMQEPGMKLAMSRLADAPTTVILLSLDRIMNTVNAAAEAVEEEPLPIEVPKLKEPLSLGGVAGPTWSRGDLFIPMELIVAIKDASMTWMGVGNAMQPEPAPAPPTAPTPVESEASAN